MSLPGPSMRMSFRYPRAGRLCGINLWCRFIRDELSKGRYDPAITKICMEILFELFTRILKTELGPREENFQVEDIC